MLIDANSEAATEVSQLNLDIEQIQRLLTIWEAQSKIHYGTAFGDAVRSIANGYAHQLESLNRALAGRIDLSPEAD